MKTLFFRLLENNFANSNRTIPELLAFLEFLLLLIEYFHLTFFFVEEGQALNCYVEKVLDNFHHLKRIINFLSSGFWSSFCLTFYFSIEYDNEIDGYWIYCSPNAVSYRVSLKFEALTSFKQLSIPFSF